jgi:hypothetical protein
VRRADSYTMQIFAARFRMKKKMKEQEIERTAKEMRERVSELEKQVDSLKQENKCQSHNLLSHLLPTHPLGQADAKSNRTSTLIFCFVPKTYRVTRLNR